MVLSEWGTCAADILNGVPIVDLPEKIITTVWVELSTDERAKYDSLELKYSEEYQVLNHQQKP